MQTLENLLRKRLNEILLILSNLYAEKKLASSFLTINTIEVLLKFAEDVAMQMNASNCKNLTIEVMFVLGNLISESDLEAVYKTFEANDTRTCKQKADLVESLISLTVKTLEQSDVSKLLIPTLFQMLG